MTLTFVVGHISNGCVAGKALALAFVQTSFNPALCKKANFFVILLFYIAIRMFRLLQQ